ncbi:hypothetical protein CEXT_675421 [Caerostris extrusa]|uniref:Uncharacterized protein n=1 Tax=Caerostris extrusa TaxID=172846 RepID=A0AAV4SVT4_CAEEX|nr:hypothetical protein CEXT_675421 [Caerostris extrusa]
MFKTDPSDWRKGTDSDYSLRPSCGNPTAWLAVLKFQSIDTLPKKIVNLSMVPITEIRYLAALLERFLLEFLASSSNEINIISILLRRLWGSVFWAWRRTVLPQGPSSRRQYLSTIARKSIV